MNTNLQRANKTTYMGLDTFFRSCYQCARDVLLLLDTASISSLGRVSKDIAHWITKDEYLYQQLLLEKYQLHIHPSVLDRKAKELNTLSQPYLTKLMHSSLQNFNPSNLNLLSSIRLASPRTRSSSSLACTFFASDKLIFVTLHQSCSVNIRVSFAWRAGDCFEMQDMRAEPGRCLAQAKAPPLPLPAVRRQPSPLQFGLGPRCRRVGGGCCIPLADSRVFFDAGRYGCLVQTPPRSLSLMSSNDRGHKRRYPVQALCCGWKNHGFIILQKVSYFLVFGYLVPLWGTLRNGGLFRTSKIRIFFVLPGCDEVRVGKTHTMSRLRFLSFAVCPARLWRRQIDGPLNLRIQPATKTVCHFLW